MEKSSKRKSFTLMQREEEAASSSRDPKPRELHADAKKYLKEIYNEIRFWDTKIENAEAELNTIEKVEVDFNAFDLSNEQKTFLEDLQAEKFKMVEKISSDLDNIYFKLKKQKTTANLPLLKKISDLI